MKFHVLVQVHDELTMFKVWDVFFKQYCVRHHFIKVFIEFLSAILLKSPQSPSSVIKINLYWDFELYY